MLAKLGGLVAMAALAMGSTGCVVHLGPADRAACDLHEQTYDARTAGWSNDGVIVEQPATGGRDVAIVNAPTNPAYTPSPSYGPARTPSVPSVGAPSNPIGGVGHVVATPPSKLGSIGVVAPSTPSRPSFGQAAPSAPVIVPSAPRKPTFGQATPSAPVVAPSAPRKPTFGQATPSAPVVVPSAPRKPSFGQATNANGVVVVGNGDDKSSRVPSRDVGGLIQSHPQPGDTVERRAGR